MVVSGRAGCRGCDPGGWVPGIWTYSGAGVGGDEAGVDGGRGRVAWGVEVALYDGVVLRCRVVLPR